VTLGQDGLQSVSENAILNANYLLSRLKSRFKPFIDETCMHECVLSGDTYASKGLKTLDIVKRLLDYGFYAPTIYFPLIVPEAMMIEPTETESKKTMDDFINAMEKIIKNFTRIPNSFSLHLTPRP
jgi:glycine dehydrogenase subunit 2